MSKRFKVQIKVVLVIISKEQVIFELVFPNPFHLKEHCKGLDQGAVVIDNLDPNEGPEHIFEMYSKPVFHLNDSHS
jgi:hypothetical protein